MVITRNRTGGLGVSLSDRSGVEKCCELCGSALGGIWRTPVTNANPQVLSATRAARFRRGRSQFAYPQRSASSTDTTITSTNYRCPQQ